ncbi:MAG: hypothetical protein R3E79_41390 [Caldilineaceae bacterium]
MILSLLRRYEGWLSFALVLTVIVLGFAGFQALFSLDEPPLPASATATATPMPVAQGDAPTLAVYPDHGPAGAYVQVTGAGWPAAEAVVILVGDGQGRSEVLARSTTTDAGTFAVGFLYPFDNRWLAPGDHLVIAAAERSQVQATTPFQVSEAVGHYTPTATAVVTQNTATPLPPVTPTATHTAVPTVAPVDTATATATPVPTAMPSPTPTDTALPSPVPTDTLVPPTVQPAINQPPVVQAALMPVNIQDEDEGEFQVQVAATDPEGQLQHVLVILKVPTNGRERAPKLKEDRKTRIKFTAKRIEIDGPDPQALLEQIEAYGGLILQNGQLLDLHIKRANEEKFELKDGVWQVETRRIALVIVATDAAGLTTTSEVSPCFRENCSAPAGNDDNDRENDQDKRDDDD